ncbi:MAG: lytic transglycosylase domain-containing protein [Bacteroidetes bacterium]|nr:lytic transglycosylase domain-containing protein [Bacteroidota bacterium]
MGTDRNNERINWFREQGIPVLFFAIVLFLVILSDPDKPAAPTPAAVENDSGFYVRNVKIPPLFFCGEKVPIEDSEVRKRITKQLLAYTFDQPSTLYLNKKAARWFPVMEPILKKNGVPEDFIYVAILESGLINSPDQPKAGGFWQLQIPVAQSYGLIINDHIDERFNIEKSTDAACKCFKDAYKHYGNWTLAAAAYDLGIGGLDKQIDKQDKRDYYKLKLSEETSDYVFRLLAFKELITHPELYGYTISKRQLYSPLICKKIEVDSSIPDLPKFASDNGTDLVTLKWMNPWISSDSTLIDDEGTKLWISIPPKGMKIYGMNNDIRKNEDSVLIDSAWRDTTGTK